MASTEAHPLFCGLYSLPLRIVRYMPPSPPIEATGSGAVASTGGGPSFLVPSRRGRPAGALLDGRGMDLELAGRSVLITGGSGGIGLATARAFAAEGCALHLAARTPATLRAARADLPRASGGATT